MYAFVLTLVAGFQFGEFQQGPVYRQLKNGVAVVVSPHPKSETVTVVLSASALGSEESNATHGWRHLIEHLVARGDGTVDLRLESAGWNLRAHTYRDCMQFVFEGPVAGLSLALDCAEELLKTPAFGKESIQKEARILQEELALDTQLEQTRRKLWTDIYGERGLSPNGTLDTIALADPVGLQNLFTTQFSKGRVSLSVAGPVTFETIVSRIERFRLNDAPTAPPVKTLEGVKLQNRDSSWALTTPRSTDPKTAIRIALVMSYLSDAKNSWFVYTPTTRDGLILFGHDGRSDRLSAAEFFASNRLTQRDEGRRLAMQWVERQLSRPSSDAEWRGMLACMSPNAKPEVLLDNLSKLSDEDLVKESQEILARITGGKP